METTKERGVVEETIRLLEYHPELGRTLRRERRAEAHASARATLVEIGPGEQGLDALVGADHGGYGALVLRGLVNRTVVLDGIRAAQLLGPGDLVHAGEGPEALVQTSTRWIVLEPLALALLDERFLLTVRRWPEIVAAMFERVAEQEDRRAVHRALCQLPRVEDRVHALLWLLAERWGRVTPQGVTLRLRLTHELIGQLVGARRPTVSLALKELKERGSVRRRADGGWLLRQTWAAPAAPVPGAASDGAALLQEEHAPV